MREAAAVPPTDDTSQIGQAVGPKTRILFFSEFAGPVDAEVAVNFAAVRPTIATIAADSNARSIKIIGTNFSVDSSVLIGSKKAAIKVESETLITATNFDEIEGTVKVTLTTAGGTVTKEYTSSP